MDYNEIILESAKLLVGGIAGTVFTSFYKDFKAKKDEQRNLFIRMVSAKSFINIPQGLIVDMNMITVLFRGKKSILKCHHDNMESISSETFRMDYDRQRGLYLDLLRAIGNKVGYKNLDNQTLLHNYISPALVSHQCFFFLRNIFLSNSTLIDLRTKLNKIN